MIRKQTLFIDKKFVRGNRIGAVEASRAEAKLSSLIRTISLYPEQSIVAIDMQVRGILQPQAAEAVNGSDFFRACRDADRTESILRTDKDDMVKCVLNPKRLHINFFWKSARQPYFEMDFLFDEEGRSYQSYVVSHVSTVSAG